MQHRGPTRPGAAPAATDDESGDGGSSGEQDLRALRVMLDRGLISQAEFDERRAQIIAAGSQECV